MTEGQPQGAEPFPFTIVPRPVIDYVETGKVSQKAAWLYVVLLGYHNRTRGDDYVWPTRKTLAAKCGVKKADSVDPLLKELQMAGLIFTEQRRDEKGMPLPSMHKLLLTPNSTEVPPSKGVPPIPGVPPNEGVPLELGVGVPPNQGVGVPPQLGYELEVLELEEVQPEEPKNLLSEGLASLAASDTTSEAQKLKGAPTTERNPLREDVDLFISVIGEDVLYDDKALFVEDYSTIHYIYDWLRTRTDQAVLTPGKFVEEIHSGGGDAAVSDLLASVDEDRDEWFEPGGVAEQLHRSGGDAAVSDWLASQGLNRAEWFQPGELAA